MKGARPVLVRGRGVTKGISAGNEVSQSAKWETFVSAVRHEIMKEDFT